VSDVRSEVATDPQRPELPTVPRKAKAPSVTRNTHGRIAVAAILEPALRHKEGIRHGSFGASGTGKTFATAAILNAALTQGAVDLVCTLDDKGRTPQYDGAQYVNPAAFMNDPAGGENPHVVFRGDLRSDVICSAEEVAAFAWDLSRLTGLPVALNIDELASAATPAGREWAAPTVRKSFNQGRALGVSVCWTTQLPQRVPPEALDQCGTVSLFRLDGRALRYLSDMIDLSPELEAILPTLQRGEFCLFQAGQPWDHTVYSF
jgi:hypothetical protein